MTLIWTLGQATVVLTLMALADVLLSRRASAATRHWLWTLALAGVVALPALAVVLPQWAVPIRSSVEAAQVMTTTESVAETVTPPAVAAKITNEGTLPSPSPVSAIESSSIFGGVSTVTLLWMVYLCGVIVLVARMIVARRAALTLVARGEALDDPRWRELLNDCARAIGCTDEVPLVRTEDCAMPMAIGTRRPTIVLPAFADEWSDDRREAVLLHELAHIARRDCLTQTMASAATALYWPHPGVWWAASRLRVERELACDDRVLTAGSPARDYASHLLEIAHALGRRRVPALGIAMARPNQLEGRLLAVIDNTRNRRVPSTRQHALVVAMVAAMLLPVAALKAVPARPVAPSFTAPGDSGAAPRAPQTQSRTRTAPRMAGTWELRPSTDGSTPTSVHLRMTDGDSSNGRSIRLDALDGMTADKLMGASSSTVRFTLKRDAGTFTFDGVCANRACGGTFAYAASTTFAGELAKRGIARPTELLQYEMARNDVQLALVDELKSQGYATPTIDELVTAGQHGVSVEYVRDFGALGYKVGQIASLVNMRDHGVTPDYIKALQEIGYRSLSADELVNARDHGVTPEFAKGIRGFGYNDVTLDELVTTRDHGVDPAFIKSMTDAGYGKLSLHTYVRMRDHGVSADWARRVNTGGNRLDADELIRRRDRGGN